ncbi:hypothetical protein GEMRC1_007929 [Eukaryota sp. GEM-RC1]
MTSLGIKGTHTDSILLLGVDPLLGGFGDRTDELIEKFSLDGRVFDLVDVTEPGIDSPATVLVLTSKNFIKFQQLRALDVLAQYSPESKELEDAERSCGPVRICALSLRLLLDTSLRLLSATSIQPQKIEQIFAKFAGKAVDPPSYLFGGNAEVLRMGKLSAGVIALSSVFDELVSCIWNEKVFKVERIKSSLIGIKNSIQVHVSLDEVVRVFGYISSDSSDRTQFYHLSETIGLTCQALCVLNFLEQKIIKGKRGLTIQETREANTLDNLSLAKLVSDPKSKDSLSFLIDSSLEAGPTRLVFTFDEIVSEIGDEAPIFFSVEDQSRLKAKELLSTASRMVAKIPTPRNGDSHEEAEARRLTEEAAGILIKTINVLPVPTVSSVLELFFNSDGFVPALIVTFETLQRLKSDSDTIESDRELLYNTLMMGLGKVFGLGIEVETVYTEVYANWLKSEIIKKLMDIPDTDFHRAFYDWFVLQHSSEILLEFPPSYYLETYITDLYRKKENRDLFWKFYVKHGKHGFAAKVLSDLATSDEDIEVSERINLLSRALTNARSVSSTSVEGDYALTREEVQQIKDFSDICEVQKRLIDRLGHVAPQVLSTKLLSLSELYNDYALRFSIPESCLEIIKISKYVDEGLVSRHWGEFFQKVSLGTTNFSTVLNEVTQFIPIIYPSENAFPLHNIIVMLQNLAYRFQVVHHDLSVTPLSIIEMLMQCDISFAEIFEAYLTIIISPSTGVFSEKKKNCLF